MQQHGVYHGAMTPCSVLIADDHALFRAGLVALLGGHAAYKVVGQASDGQQAVDMAAQLRPDLLLLDLSMPRLSGLSALPAIKAASPATRVLVVSMHDGREHVLRALREGADGYLLKDTSTAELGLALDALRQGRRYLSPAVSGDVVAAALGTDPPAPADLGPGLQLLTARQIEVLRLLASGKAAKEIAFSLQLSVKTVETHRAQIMERLQIRDLPHLVLFALRHGLIDAEVN